MNKLLLVGRLTKQPKVFGSDENKVCVFTIAVKRAYSNQNGDYEADFIQVKTFKKTAENCSKFLQKGSMVSVEASIRTGSHDKDGKTVYTSENIVDVVRFLGGLKDSNGNGNNNSNNNRSNGNSNQNRNNQNNNNNHPIDEDPFAGNENYNASGDDDWPF
jgi:single-strand DNA-binding protein